MQPLDRPSETPQSQPLPQDDNLIRLMLQPPKTGKDDPLLQQSNYLVRKLRRR